MLDGPWSNGAGIPNVKKTKTQKTQNFHSLISGTWDITNLFFFSGSIPGARLRLQGWYVEFWDNSHWVSNRSSTLSQIPSYESNNHFVFLMLLAVLLILLDSYSCFIFNSNSRCLNICILWNIYFPLISTYLDLILFTLPLLWVYCRC